MTTLNTSKRDVMKGANGSVDRKTRETLRERAVTAVLREDIPVKMVAKVLQVHRSRVYEWVARARKYGMEALKSRLIPGRRPAISESQQNQLKWDIFLRTPLDFGFESRYWTRDLVRAYIERQFGINLSVWTVGRLLHQLDFTPQRPIRRAEERDPTAISEWVRSKFKEISKLADMEGATIFFMDEASVRNDYHAGTTWGQKGITPIIPMSGHRQRVNLISSINFQGGIHYRVGDETVNSLVFIEYLKSLVASTDRHIFLILDSHPVHCSRLVNEYVSTTEGKLKLFYLPYYAPELNPVELLWNIIKPQGIARYLTRNARELADKAIHLLESIKATPEKVCALFREESVNYISTALSSNSCPP